MFIIQINELQGVELVLKALRATPCIASKQLADGIERTFLYIDENGNAMHPGDEPVRARPALSVVK